MSDIELNALTEILYFLVKLICLISILVSISVFIFVVVNLEKTKTKIIALKKNDIKSELNDEEIKPGKFVLQEVVLDEEDSNNTEKIEIYETEKQEVIEENTEIELNTENCEYSYDSTAETITIDKYETTVDSIIIPTEIDGKKVEYTLKFIGDEFYVDSEVVKDSDTATIVVSLSTLGVVLIALIFLL